MLKKKAAARKASTVGELKDVSRKAKKGEVAVKLSIPATMTAPFSDMALVGHGPNEFFLDFFQTRANTGEEPICVARVALTPPHMLRLIEVLAGNYKKYKDKSDEVAAQQP